MGFNVLQHPDVYALMLGHDSKTEHNVIRQMLSHIIIVKNNINPYVLSVTILPGVHEGTAPVT